MSRLAPREVITGFPDRKAFLDLVGAQHPGIVVKFTAGWCGPCKRIDPIVKSFFSRNSGNMLCCYLDIDENFDLYSFMKRKKMANGVPTLLYYAPDNHEYVPTASVSGANEDKVRTFFDSIRV